MRQIGKYELERYLKTGRKEKKPHIILIGFDLIRKNSNVTRVCVGWFFMCTNRI